MHRCDVKMTAIRLGDGKLRLTVQKQR
jgi:hypothetical protein